MSAALEQYEKMLRRCRGDVLKILDGLDADALNWHPLAEGTNSVYALAVHLLGGERYFLHVQIGGRPNVRDRAAEFRAAGDGVSALRAQYETVARASAEILERLTEAELDAPRGAGEEKFTYRWCILQTIRHYGEHTGHMALTRQLWEQRAARPHEI